MSMELRGGSATERALRMVFQLHVTVYVMVNLFLIMIWMLAGFGSFWPIWTIVPWGFVLVVHGWLTWGLPAVFRR